MRSMRLPALPVASAMPGLCAALGRDGCAVLSAPPGSGKTTLVPLLLLDEPWLAGERIVVLEPRRVAARAAAARMASLLGERVGETVGYQVRFERKISASTRIEVITEGLLTRRLQADPELPGVGLVIFDEFHERSLDADLGLALTLDARAALRPQLRVLVMSATLDTRRIATLLDGAEVIESGGRLFPVEMRYAPPRAGVALEESTAAAAGAALGENTGDVLVFLPGAREIRATQAALERRLEGHVDIGIHLLYGDLSSAQQDAALAPAPAGQRKVILATNLAQTSLTIEGVATVVDSGLARVARFDLGAGANRLETVRISRAAADQRAGRAGRLGPGACIRLWSRDQQAQLAAHDTPEILAADFSRAALELAAWGTADPASLALLDRPTAASLSYARELLTQINAIDDRGRITAHGRMLIRLPAPPRIAHMLLAAQRISLGVLAAWIAATLDGRSEGGDLAAEVERLRSGRGVDAYRRRQAADSVRQFLRLIDADEAGPGSDALDLNNVGRVASLAFPERLARKRERQRDPRSVHYLCADGGEARLAASDPLAASEWLAIAHWQPGAPRRVLSAASMTAADVLRDHAAALASHDEVRWDAQSETVVAERQRRLGAIVLERQSLTGGASEAVRSAMLEGVRNLGVAALPWDAAARQWQARVQSLRAWRPDENWPDMSDAALAERLDDWLAPYLDGISRREHLSRLQLAAILPAQLDHAQQQQLARWAPTHLAVPSGSHVALEYAAEGSPPVLAVKLQELFGLTRTPVVNEGRTQVALHLLSPGRRPIQVTQDLAGFWERTYPEVRKELKGRYPRHPWPDDPLAAPPTARAKPRSGRT